MEQEDKYFDKIHTMCTTLSKQNVVELKNNLKDMITRSAPTTLPEGMPKVADVSKMLKADLCKWTGALIYGKEGLLSYQAHLESIIDDDIDSIPKEFKDPVNLSVMTHPVVTNDGQTMDKSTFNQCMAGDGQQCPITRQRLKYAAPNYLVQTLMDKWFQAKLGVTLDSLKNERHAVHVAAIAQAPQDHVLRMAGTLDHALETHNILAEALRVPRPGGNIPRDIYYQTLDAARLGY